MTAKTALWVVLLAIGLPTVDEARAAPAPREAPAAVEAPATETPPTEPTTVAAPIPAAPSEAPAAQPPAPSASAWPAILTVQACPFAPPILPAQAETALDATLLVQTSEGFGSAVLVSPDGFALTAAHLLGSSDDVQLVGHGGHTLRGTVVRVDEAQDVALLKVAIAGAAPCLPPLEGRAPVGSDVFVLGSPAGAELSFSVSKGIVSAHRQLEGFRFVQLDAALNPGNSGGPAVSPEGKIVGIASWKVSHVSMEGLAFAVPVDVALQALGVTLGVTSSPDWAALAGRHGTTRPSARKEPRRAAVASPPDPALLRKRRVRRGLITWGATALGTGVATIGITVGVYYQKDSMTTGGWAALQAVNAVGWGLAIGGSGMLLGGLLVRTKPKPDRAAMQLVPAGRGLVLHGRF